MLAILGFFIGVGFASPQQQYDEGTQLLAEKQYQKASVAFQQALENGGIDSRVYHGLGNALFHQQKEGRAIVAWRRGLLLDPNNQDLQHNLQFIEQGVPQQGIYMLASPVVWIGIGSLCGSLLILLPFFVGLRKTWGAVGISFVAMIFSGWAGYQYELQYQKGVVFASSVVAKSAPNGGGIDLFTLSTGDEIEILEQQENDLFIENSDKERGWVSTLSVMSLDPKAEFSIQ